MRRSTDAGGRVGLRLAVGVAVLLAAAAPLRAGSISFSGGTTGVFTNPLGDTFSGAGTDSISFGTPPGALSFTGGSFTAAAGQVFALGSIGFYNAENVSPLMGVDLGLTLNLTDGSKAPGTLTLPLTVTNTLELGQPDQLVLKPDTELGTITGSDGKTYSLMVKGFGSGCDCNGMTTYSPTLAANEGQVVCTAIYGQIVDKGPPT
ncbi:MAG TPA: choice-of-anchor K domain-containing protein, partial [Gemmataceae bacterium]